MNGKCETCRFWDTSESGNFRICWLFSDDPSFEQSAPTLVDAPERMAVIIPFAGANGATFETMAVFGCDQWQNIGPENNSVRHTIVLDTQAQRCVDCLRRLEMKQTAEMQHSVVTELQAMLSYATPVEALIILPMIERAAVLERDLASFARALSETRKTVRS